MGGHTQWDEALCNCRSAEGIKSRANLMNADHMTTIITHHHPLGREGRQAALVDRERVVDGGIKIIGKCIIYVSVFPAPPVPSGLSSGGGGDSPFFVI